MPRDTIDGYSFSRRAGEVDHLVTFHRSVPGGGEESAFTARTQAIRALAAHADGARGPGDATGAGQFAEEVELASGGPPVAADAGTFGLRLGLVHRPAWITKGVL